MRKTIDTMRIPGWDLEKIVSTLNQKQFPAKRYGEKWSRQAIISLNPLLKW